MRGNSNLGASLESWLISPDPSFHARKFKKQIKKVFVVCGEF